MNHKVKTILAVTGIAAVSIHILNRLQFTLSTVKNSLACSNNNYYEWRFGKIRYIKKGSGSPLLLLHDLTQGSSSYEFKEIIDELAKQHEVYALDFLGYGLSDKPNITYTNYLYVQLVSDFIKTIIGRKTTVMATGDASPVIIMACHNDDALFDKLLLISPQSINKLNMIPNRQTKLLKFLIDIPVLGTFIYNTQTCQAFYEKSFEKEYFSNPAAVNEELIHAYRESSHHSDYTCKYSFASYIGRYMNANIIHALKEINNSVILLYGSDRADIDTIVDNYLFYNSSIETVKIPDTKHLIHLEAPSQFNKQIQIYFD